jgi:Ca-activated chloride channel family protein
MKSINSKKALWITISALFIVNCSSSETQVKNDYNNDSDFVVTSGQDLMEAENQSYNQPEVIAPQAKEELRLQVDLGSSSPVVKSKPAGHPAKMARNEGAVAYDMMAGSAAMMTEHRRIAPPSPPYNPGEDFNTEEYDYINENSFKLASQEPLSTFSIDVDNASYSNVRRYLSNNQLPPADAVRIEEMINYFNYDYAQPRGKHPFSLHTEVSTSPWNSQRKLVHIGIQGKSAELHNLKPSNLVFLIDASGSMSSANKMPLLKKSLGLLLNELSSNDRVAIVAYAGSAGLILPSTPASNREAIFNALNNIEAGGSTAGGQGIQLAYSVALNNLIPEGNNRVILATDGDFNVGTSSTSELVRLIEEKRKNDIYLTICGFGMGNYKDGRMEQISNAGNGNYFYIDNEKEARKVFVQDMRANMFTIAKDVKIQIEFNPAKVKAYRLIGYENRVMANKDFNDDTKDAGELGAGHTVTALYEIIPAGSSEEINGTDPLRYQKVQKSIVDHSNELMTLKFRYKPLKSNQSLLITHALRDENVALNKTSDTFRFSAAVAAFGQILRNSEHQGSYSLEDVLSLAGATRLSDPEGHRAEFIELVRKARNLKPHQEMLRDKLSMLNN